MDQLEFEDILSKDPLSTNIGDVNYSDHYAEPGYEQPIKGILLATNWNAWSNDCLQSLEKSGYSLEYEETWASCTNCNGLVRVIPNSYTWQPSFLIIDSDLLCFECCTPSDVEVYLESIENKPTQAFNNTHFKVTDYGYKLLHEGYDSGLHKGMNDDPKSILNEYKAEYDRLLFVISDVSQFYVAFDIYYKEVEVN